MVIQKRYKWRMFGISGEHLLVLGILLLIFGPRRLPALGNTLGKAMKNFKDSISGIEEAKFRRIEERVSDPNSVIASTQTSAPTLSSTLDKEMGAENKPKKII